jgi:predicted patatin/cPLA2 family phospholipase
MPKRSLILAGGGLKVGFQAGVLQVWLDEAGLKFDHADGASGGCLNLAMYCQGMSGAAIAENWRNYDPILPTDLNLEGPGQFAHQQSFFTYDDFRAKVLPRWGIDFNKIRNGKLGTFTLFNFSKKRLEAVTNDKMDEDRLVSAVSLPMWFPPVVIDGDTYIDAVYVCDANVEEAIRRGADEIWAIWTVSKRDEWRPGFVAQYFHIIEATANANFFGIWRRLEENNAAIARGEQGEFGRTIALKLIEAEVPVHYIFNLGRDRMAEAVNQGVVAAREWCRKEGIALQAPAAPGPAAPPSTPKVSLQFTETMRGFLGTGADFQSGHDHGKKQKAKFDVRFTIRMEDAAAFIVDPNHEASCNGTIDSPLVGGKVPAEGGRFNLLVNDGDPRKKHMHYRIFFKHANGSPLTMVGFKNVEDDKSQPEVWEDTTVLYTTLYAGHVEAAAEAHATKVAVGIIRIGIFDFIPQLTTFRTEGGTPADRLAAMTRFGFLFLGKLQEVYGGFLQPV